MTRTKLTFGPPDVIVERRPDGALMARSPHPLSSYPRAVTDWLDHWAGVARVPRVSRRARGRKALAHGHVWRGAPDGAQRRARRDRSRAFRRTAGRDPLGQQRRSRGCRTWRDDRRRPLRARVGALFARRQGFREVEDDHRPSDAGPRLRQRRRALRRGDRGGGAAGRRGRRALKPAGVTPLGDAGVGPLRSRPGPRSTPRRRRSGRIRSRSSCSLRGRPARPRASSTPIA